MPKEGGKEDIYLIRRRGKKGEGKGEKEKKKGGRGTSWIWFHLGSCSKTTGKEGIKGQTWPPLWPSPLVRMDKGGKKKSKAGILPCLSKKSERGKKGVWSLDFSPSFKKFSEGGKRKKKARSRTRLLARPCKLLAREGKRKKTRKMAFPTWTRGGGQRRRRGREKKKRGRTRSSSRFSQKRPSSRAHKRKGARLVGKISSRLAPVEGGEGSKRGFLTKFLRRSRGKEKEKGILSKGERDDRPPKERTLFRVLGDPLLGRRKRGEKRGGIAFSPKKFLGQRFGETAKKKEESTCS